MGKRSDFPRRKNDAYMTPCNKKIVAPIIPFIRGRTFVEPCAGDGKFAKFIEDQSFCNCLCKYDIEPKSEHVQKRDVMEIEYTVAKYFITNLPWTREILHPLIKHLSAIAPTWLLFDSDWHDTAQSAPYMEYCAKVVPVGRISWLQNGVSGKDNCSWYLFDQNNHAPTVFYPKNWQERILENA